MTDRRLRAIVFDIDGVLTDGTVHIDFNGHESKVFRLTEIDALNDIKNDGYIIAAVTGEDTKIVNVFERIIKWDRFIRGCKDKDEALNNLCQELDLDKSEICYIGDGKYDIPAIMYAGLGVCPSNAIKDVKDIADVVLEGKGGESCIYELLILLRGLKQENVS